MGVAASSLIVPSKKVQRPIDLTDLPGVEKLTAVEKDVSTVWQGIVNVDKIICWIVFSSVLQVVSFRKRFSPTNNP